MKNANAKGFNNDRKQSSSSQFKNQEEERRMLRKAVNTLFLPDQNVSDVKVLDT